MKLLLRRLMALSYDVLLCVGLVLTVQLLFALLCAAFGVDLFSPPARLVNQVVLATALIGYYILFITCFGCTPGMRAWRLRIVSNHNAQLRWPQALARLAYATISSMALGLGWWWIVFTGNAWHDIWSASRVVHTPPTTK